MAEGSRVGRYRVDAVIARGGMGIVYRATDPALERSVALKVIAPELARDEEFRARFVRESRLAAALDHPNVHVSTALPRPGPGRLGADAPDVQSPVPSPPRPAEATS